MPVGKMLLPDFLRRRNQGSNAAALDHDARRSPAVTCTGVQTPPRAVATPRALSALAMARNDVAPLAFICSMTGSTLAAKRSAFALLEAIPRRCACLSL